MIQQGLRMDIVPIPGTASTYSVTVYSHGFIDGQLAVTRNLMVVPLTEESPVIHAGEFAAWVQHMVDVAANEVCRVLEVGDVESLSAAYAHAEDAEEKASHRM